MINLHEGHALDLIQGYKREFSLVVTDPPYAFSGSGKEHAISATVATVLRESAQRLVPGGWMVVMCASSWRSMAYMVEATRGIVEPVRIGTWVKTGGTSKVKTPGWCWSTAAVIALRRGKSLPIPPSDLPDWCTGGVVKKGRRAQLPDGVCDWMVQPFATRGGLALDPFAGSGAILRACERAGMDAEGFELGEGGDRGETG